MLAEGLSDPPRPPHRLQPSAASLMCEDSRRSARAATHHTLAREQLLCDRRRKAAEEVPAAIHNSDLLKHRDWLRGQARDATHAGRASAAWPWRSIGPATRRPTPAARATVTCHAGAPGEQENGASPREPARRTRRAQSSASAACPLRRGPLRVGQWRACVPRVKSSTTRRRGWKGVRLAPDRISQDFPNIILEPPPTGSDSTAWLTEACACASCTGRRRGTRAASRRSWARCSSRAASTRRWRPSTSSKRCVCARDARVALVSPSLTSADLPWSSPTRSSRSRRSSSS
jgi:hypothetical protein